MVEWLGQLLAHAPLWIVLPVAVVAGVIWAVSPYGLDTLFPEKKEWWQDKERRLKKESQSRKLKKG